MSQPVRTVSTEDKVRRKRDFADEEDILLHFWRPKHLVEVEDSGFYEYQGKVVVSKDMTQHILEAEHAANPTGYRKLWKTVKEQYIGITLEEVQEFVRRSV